jgi:cysteinyl-tRNA synthetase
LDPRAIRYLLLSVHYRQKQNFTFASVEGATAALRRIDDLRFRLDHAREGMAARPEVSEAAARLSEEFAAALGDDLNTSAALAAVHRFLRDVNLAIEEDRLAPGDRALTAAALRQVDAVLGVLHQEDWTAAGETAAGEAAPAPGLAEADVEALVAEREAARRSRDFRRSDAIRDQLREGGVLIEDTASGPRWRRQ